MKRKLLLAAVIFASLYIGGVIGYNLKQPVVAAKTAQTSTIPVVAPKPPSIQQLWSLTNEERSKASLGALSLNPSLDESASVKCNDMVKRNYWSHIDPDGNHAWSLISEHYGEYGYAGENLAYGTRGAEDTVSRWMKSTEHRENILKPVYTDVGFAVCHSNNFVNSGSQYLIVQHFASR